MKRLVVYLFVVVLCATTVHVGAATSAPQRDSDTVKSVDRDYWHSFLFFDWAAFDRLVADDASFQSNGDDRRKKDFVKDFEDGLKNGPVKIHDLTTNVTVTFKGDQAVVAGRLDVRVPR